MMQWTRRLLTCNRGMRQLFTSNLSIGNMATELGASTDVICDVISKAQYPSIWPFSADSFSRLDESDDAVFYGIPRFVNHIDDAAIYALTLYYGEIFDSSSSEAPEVLDLCSSWTSHYPSGARAVGIGMVAAELERNGQLGRYVVQDLNKSRVLPFPDASFDYVTCTVSIDYLTSPKEVMSEVLRVLKQGGSAHIAFSNRMFPTKAVAIWRATGDADHVWIVGAFFHYATYNASRFTAIEALDLSPSDHIDPLYVVRATKA